MAGPWELVPTGTSSTVLWTGGHAREPEVIAPSSPGEACHALGGRAGPSDAHVVRETGRRLSIPQDLSCLECQENIWSRRSRVWNV